MDGDSAMERLRSLKRDLTTFAETRMVSLDRLSAEFEASIEDLRNLLDKKRRSEESRKTVNPPVTPKPDTLKIEDEEYKVTEDFRAAVLQVSDELDLDELEAAKLCIQAGAAAEGQPDTSLAFQALIRFHAQRNTVLECVRLLLVQTVDLDAGDEVGEAFRELVRRVVRGQDGGPDAGSAYWRKCMEGFTDIEGGMKKVAAHKETALMTGLPEYGDAAEALIAQRILLARGHESLASIMSYLIRGGHTAREDFRSLLSKAAALEGLPIDVTFHYLPILISGSAYFGADESTTSEAAKDLHRLFATGPGQLQWKQPAFKAATTVCWLAEYSSRFLDPTSAQTLRVADRQKEEEERSKLFLDAVKDKAFHFMLLACQFFKPEVWHDPAKVGFVRFLLEDTPHIPSHIPTSSPEFADLVMNELQAFSDAFVSNMPDVLRRLKAEEDDRRRAFFSGPAETGPSVELDLERFLVIMAYAYQDDPEAAQDFWSDKENNLYGFLRWASQRLPTPRVAAFCELLRAIASDEKSGNQAHLFLREDTVMTGGKLRKSYSVSWAQIFSELEIYASTIKNKPATVQQVANADGNVQDGSYVEPETYIMLEFYMRLAAHVCRISPDARNWILREQTFHLGETLFHLASAGHDSRIHANCFDMLAALLTDKIPEVSDGMWVLLDNWITGGGYGGSSSLRPGRQAHPERQYLLNYVSNPETATGLVNLLCALVTPAHSQTELILDALPFPENLGIPNRHAGIEVYVDWVLGTVFRSTSSHPALAGDMDLVALDVLRCVCLNFACICLSTFNEDLVALANATNLGVDSAMRTSSLAAYAKLHPFARAMDWMFNNNVINALAHVVHQDIDELNALDPSSPRVQATLRSVQLMNLGMKLQATYFDIVRPLIGVEPGTRIPSIVNTSLSSYDEVVLSQLDVVVEITSFAASINADLSLESMSLLQKLCASRKLGDAPQFSDGSRTRVGSRLVGKLSERADAITREILPYFEIFEWDVESGEQPFKIIKAKAVLDVLNNSLDTSGGRPAIAHCLLGFQCHLRSVDIRPGSAFSQADSLFHSIATCAAQAPCAIGENNVSWLMALKRGCLDVVLKLALSPLTAAIVLPELRAMEFLAAASRNQILALANPLWDQRVLQDPALLLDSSALAVRDFLHVRDDFFEYAALELRSVTENRAFSVQEKVVSTLLGSIKFPNGDQDEANSVFDLFDMFDMETSTPSDATCKYFKDIDLSICLKDDPETVTSFDVGMAEQNLILKKLELFGAGIIKDTYEEMQVDDEIRAILASLTSMNNWRAIQEARISTLESWTDLMSLLAAQENVEGSNMAVIALQGLQVVLPRLEKTLSDDLDSAALLAKLTLTLVPAASSDGSSQRAGLAYERLVAAFRVSLKGITDSGTALALRDVCYRICCAVLASTPLTTEIGKRAPSPNARQLLQLIQGSGDRLITVITEDAFSGRGMTRVSSLLFLDALVALFQIGNLTTAILRALTKLNFVPVLIDQSIGSIASSFQGDNGELLTAVAYFHTAMSLLLRICQTADGTQLVLNSGFFAATADSKLFSTDPDIGLDIDNPVALREFYKLLSAVLRVVTAAVVARGPGNATVLQQAKNFLQQNRFSMQAVFKRTSEVKKTAGPPEKEALDVADEFSKLLLVTGFLEDDEPAHIRAARVNGYT